MSRAVDAGNDAVAPDANQSAYLAVPEDNSITASAAGAIEGGPDIRAPRRTAADFTRLLTDAALQMCGHGINVVTVGGDKRPNLGAWADHQRIRQTVEIVGGLPFDRAYGIAGVCGNVSGSLLCMDFDRVPGDRLEFGYRVLDALGLPRDYAWLVITPGGVHVWLRLIGDTSGLGKLIGHLLGCHHVELRFNGHIAILPPSKRKDGETYRYANVDSTPADAPAEVTLETVLAIAEWDEPKTEIRRGPKRGILALAGQTVTPEYVDAAIQGELDKVSAAAEGHRNDTVFRAAAAVGSLLHLGIDEDQVADRLFDAARQTGLPDDEIVSAIRSGFAKGAENPRDLILREPSESAVEVSRPAYPLHVLSPVIRAFVVEAAACVGCPPDMVAVPLLAYAAATIGRTRSIEIKVRYVKHPVFWFGIVGAPGSGKSPADGLARSFVETLQARAYADWQQAYQEWRLEHELWKQRVKGKGGGKAKMGGETYDVDPEPEEPVLEHYFTTDATIEALAPILLSSAGVAVAHDELVGWVKSMGAYNGAAGRDRAQVLSLWAERSLKVDRKGRPPLYVEDPVAVIIGGVQPDVLADLAGEADKRDGFVDRFLWSWPEHRPVPWTEDTVSPFTTAAVETVFRRLRATGGNTAPVMLLDEAKALWRTWYDENARAMEAERGLMAGVRAKADVQLARLALVLHVLEHDDPDAVDVSVETLRAAIELVEYHLAHARAVAHRLGVAGNTPRTGHGSTLRQRIVARLEEHGGWVSASDLAKGLGGHIPAPERDAELDRLEADGLVQRRIKESGELGGRPAVQWRYHVNTCELKNPECAA